MNHDAQITWISIIKTKQSEYGIFKDKLKYIAKIKKLEGIFLTSFLLMFFAAPFLVTFYYFYLFFHKKWVLNIVYNCVIDFVLIYVLVLPSHNILNCKFFFFLIYFK